MDIFGAEIFVLLNYRFSNLFCGQQISIYFWGMSENQSNIDHEAIDLRSEEEIQDILTEGDYIIQTLNAVSANILSDEFHNRNKTLIHSMIKDFRDRDNRQGDMPPKLAGRSLEVFFSAIAKYGLR